MLIFEFLADNVFLSCKGSLSDMWVCSQSCVLIWISSVCLRSFRICCRIFRIFPHKYLRKSLENFFLFFLLFFETWSLRDRKWFCNDLSWNELAELSSSWIDSHQSTWESFLQVCWVRLYRATTLRTVQVQKNPGFSSTWELVL